MTCEKITNGGGRNEYIYDAKLQKNAMFFTL